MAYRAMLERLEYSRLGLCPICNKHEKDDGHEDWCELATLLRESEVEG